MQVECISDMVEVFLTQAKTLTITTTNTAVMAAEVLIKALHNPTAFNNAEALHDTASNTLTKLIKVYEMNKEPSSPRVRNLQGWPVPGVAAKPMATSVKPISAQTQSATAAANISANNVFYTNVGHILLHTPSQGQLWNTDSSSVAWQLKMCGKYQQPTNLAISHTASAAASRAPTVDSPC
jgi:hypothetical protein